MLLVQNGLLNNTMTLKHYIVEDLRVLPQLEAWVSVAQNRTQLFRSALGDSMEYRVVVEDGLGMTACSPQFELEFQGAVRAQAFPE